MLIADLKKVQKTSLSDGILEQMTGLIARGVLKPGDRIPSEKQLCQQFGVGRTSVREALRSLSVMGILESHAGDGTFVSSNRDRYLERAFQWGLLLDRKVVEDLVERGLFWSRIRHTSRPARPPTKILRNFNKPFRAWKNRFLITRVISSTTCDFTSELPKATQNHILETLLSTIRGICRFGYKRRYPLRRQQLDSARHAFDQSAQADPVRTQKTRTLRKPGAP